jgi:hypothetical protein
VYFPAHLHSIQARHSLKTQQSYLNGSPEGFGPTIGSLLYRIAVYEANWLYTGILNHQIPDEIEALFQRNLPNLSRDAI